MRGAWVRRPPSSGWATTLGWRASWIDSPLGSRALSWRLSSTIWERRWSARTWAAAARTSTAASEVRTGSVAIAGSGSTTEARMHVIVVRLVAEELRRTSQENRSAHVVGARVRQRLHVRGDQPSGGVGRDDGVPVDLPGVEGAPARVVAEAVR